MCTLSWLRKGKNYTLFFNRDESVAREKALPPRVYEENDVRFIMPLDPQGGGSWLAVNETGLSLALLNFYQGRWPKGRLSSRGGIVKKLASANTLQAIETGIKQFSLQRYAPFSLLVFELGDKKSIPCLRWDGKTLQLLQLPSPFFSSAVDFSEVSAYRQRLFADALAKLKGKPEKHEEAQEALHRSHLPEKSRLSICMHREDAHTVSFSKIEVNKNAVRFFYSDGAPCENTITLQAELALLTAEQD